MDAGHRSLPPMSFDLVWGTLDHPHLDAQRHDGEVGGCLSRRMVSGCARRRWSTTRRSTCPVGRPRCCERRMSIAAHEGHLCARRCFASVESETWRCRPRREAVQSRPGVPAPLGRAVTSRSSRVHGGVAAAAGRGWRSSTSQDAQHPPRCSTERWYSRAQRLLAAGRTSTLRPASCAARSGDRLNTRNHPSLYRHTVCDSGTQCHGTPFS
jgi:hypothetical protein